MGILGKVKNKLSRHEEEDFDDIRSQVLGDRLEFDDNDIKRNAGPDPFPPQKKIADRFSMDADLEPATPFAPARQERENLALEQNNNYEILDRLKFIESQLSAIKSQTELINERLKILDTKMGRRY